MTDANALIARGDRLASDRGTFDSHWQEIRDLILPMGVGFTTKETPGVKAHSQVLDGTGEDTSETCASGINGLITNAQMRWFGVRAKDERINRDEESALWLEHATDRMFTVFNSPLSNFQPNAHELYLDLVDYGTGGMFIGDRPGEPLLFQSRPLVELYLAENAEGRVDTVYRRFELTARQAVQEWGIGAVGEKVAKALDKNPDEKFKFLHCVEPRQLYDLKARDAARLPVASCFVGLDDKRIVKESGFHEMPFVTPRWAKRSGEVFGRGPGTKALADVKMLQRAMKITLRAIEKTVDPPLIVADDGVLSPVRVTASGINTVRADMMAGNRRPIEALHTGANPQLGEEFMTGVRSRIGRAFYNHLFMMQRTDRMTATEVLQVVEEIMRVLGPILARLQIEFLGPLIDRVFAVLWRQGAFDPPPPAIAGADLEIEYLSPIAKAQRLGEARSISQLFEIWSPYLATHPELLDNLEGDRAFRDTAIILGTSRDWLRGERSRDQLRQARNDAQAKAAQLAGVEQLAGAAADGAKAVKTLAPGGAGGEPAAAAA